MCYKYCLLRSDVIWYIGTKMQRNMLPLFAEDGGSLFFRNAHTKLRVSLQQLYVDAKLHIYMCNI